jgi:hypothetical protein
MGGVKITIIRAKNNNNKYKTINQLNPIPNYCLLAVIGRAYHKTKTK